MVTRLSPAIKFIFFQLIFIVRVLSDVPGQSAGDLVDGLSKAEEEVFSHCQSRKEKNITSHTGIVVFGHTMGLKLLMCLFLFDFLILRFCSGLLVCPLLWPRQPCCF